MIPSTRSLLRFSAVGVVAVMVVALAAARVPGGGGDIFELEGDAFDDPMSAAEDWSLLYDDGNNTGGSSIAFTDVVPDPGQDTIFKGGKKDIQDITRWGWKNDGGFPDKNDITNAYVAGYRDMNGDVIVYFGADRFSNTGDAFLGFWFFRENVTLLDDGTFDGQHQEGDVLVLVNYPQGANAVPEIAVVEWDETPENEVASNLDLLFNSTTAVCGSVPPADACAITNLVQEPSPWDYEPKSGTSGFFPPESFFEGGINLTAILGGEPCFSTFLAETRSSSQFTATLKDFVLGDFPLCTPGLELTWACSTSLESVECTGGSRLVVRVDYTGTVTNTGDVSLEVTAVDELLGTVLDPTVLGAGESLPVSGVLYPTESAGDPTSLSVSSTATATGTNPAVPSVSAEASTDCSLCPPIE